MNKNYLRQKQPSCLAALSPAASPEMNHSPLTTHYSHKPKLAFSLAETLITLGIIGVVAAITMPVLISNIQDRVKQKRVENIKQKLSKVTDKMAVQSGLVGYGTTEAFVSEMTKHMKVAKVCDNNYLADCWPTQEVNLNKFGKMWQISETKNPKTLLLPRKDRDNWDNTIGIVTADGVPMILSYKKNCDFDVDKNGLIFNESSAMSNSMGCLSGVFDWNGGKNPNKLGDDVITIGKAAGLGYECVAEISGKCITAPFVSSPLTKAQCEAQKDDLGIKKCPVDLDYWAGAAEECGGVKNMTSMADLSKVATLIYKGHPTLGPYERFFSDAGIVMDTATASSLGFSTSQFYVWTSEEGPYRDFGSTYFTYYHGAPLGFDRSYASALTMCLEE